MKTDEEVLEKTTGLAQAVIRVGDGRGFMVERQRQRFVLTAAHCLPRLPPAHPMPDTKKCTYETLLGPLGVKPTVSAECLFADPVADIAILSGPDSQALFDQAEAYEEFMDDKVPLIIGDAPKEGRKQVVLPGDGPFAGSFTIKTPRRGSARLLSLDGKWLDCSVERYGRGLSVVDDDLVRSGMSGSPIVMADLAIGLISTGRLNPILKDCLPAWFLRR